MRFVRYKFVGGDLAAHIDLSRTDAADGTISTHTFLLYTTDNKIGGATALLRTLPCVRGAKKEGKKGGKKVLDEAARAEAETKGGAAEGGGVEGRAAEPPGGTGEGGGDSTIAGTAIADGIWHDDGELLASVSPRRGRLLVFPHVCPHEGRPVSDVPKVFLRGECVM